ncbi:MAG TPA: TetR family transcriptional regulator [Pseudonocardiaceae bacterium]|jgi:AcrR family transcriptional regulator|nr:TetR family transcriptional regulator [Pseudonocardiaceae bacterium]
MAEDVPPRRRDADATRAALLTAARDLFAERGFEQTTVRDIAARAGVNQALLFRYFGSKDGLFDATMTSSSRELINETPPELLLLRTMERMFAPDAPTADASPFYAVLRSAAHKGAKSMVSDDAGSAFAAVLASLTDAPNAELRADLVLSWILGIGLLRYVLVKEPIAHADPDELTDCVLKAVSVLLERSAQRPPAD